MSSELTTMPGANFDLINGYQRGFPLESRPFANIGAALGLAESEVLSAFQGWQLAGLVSRIGAVFAPGSMGVSTLAAMAVPPACLPQVAACVSGHAEVNHNYAREHRYNLWFVVTAADQWRLHCALKSIEAGCGYPVLSLPLREEFHIDLGFDLTDGSRQGGGERAVEPSSGGAACAMPDIERRLLLALQDGLPLVAQPYAAIGEKAGISEALVLEIIERWLAEGRIKRFGVVVRHHELGFSANAMCVWDVPDALASELGRRLAAEPAVTLCYRRQRALPDWSYNLFCMIHGKERDEVSAARDTLAARLGLDVWPHAVLFSGERFKQRGARYIEAHHLAEASSDEARHA